MAFSNDQYGDRPVLRFEMVRLKKGLEELEDLECLTSFVAVSPAVELASAGAWLRLRGLVMWRLEVPARRP